MQHDYSPKIILLNFYPSLKVEGVCKGSNSSLPGVLSFYGKFITQILLAKTSFAVKLPILTKSSTITQVLLCRF